MASSKRRKLSSYWVITTVVVGVLALVGVLLWKPGANKTIDTFQSCKDAGGSILESYPERCMVNGKSFTNTTQMSDSNPDAYVGLAEQAALDKAKSEAKAARVVERDGQALSMTMDYAPGRLNLFVKDGKVYKVQIEGSESQSK